MLKLITAAIIAIVSASQPPSLPGTARRPTRFRRGAVKSKLLAGGSFFLPLHRLLQRTG